MEKSYTLKKRRQEKCHQKLMSSFTLGNELVGSSLGQGYRPPDLVVIPIDLSSRAKRGTSVLLVAPLVVASARTQVPRFARDDKVGVLMK
jgi:hypothetical protein